MTAYYVRTDASAALDRADAVTLAVALAAGLWLTLAPPRALTTSRRAHRAGLGAGVAIAAGLLLNARLTGGIGLYVLAVPVVVLFLASALVAATDGGFRSGLQAAVWSLVATCLLTFAVYAVEGFRIQRTGVHPVDGDPTAGPTGVALHEAIVWVLGVIPALALPAAVIGAALGAIGAAPQPPAAPRDPGPAPVS